MTGLGSLWLPILLSAVFVFLASSVIHMATPWRKGDFLKLPNEEAVRSALGPLAIPPGDYAVPRPSSMKDMGSPEFLEKMNKGPIVVMTVRANGRPSMATSLGLWFLYAVVVGVFAAYIAGRALPVGAHYLAVFRFAGATAFIGYSLALWQSSIWYGRSWITTIKSNVDGLLYALLTAGTFGWLWPR